MKELEDISVKIPTTIPAFEDMTWIEKEMFFGQHIYYVDGKDVKELDHREVIVNNYCLCGDNGTWGEDDKCGVCNKPIWS